jgi:RNA polymerase sigma-70 factor (ECF subfamily)
MPTDKLQDVIGLAVPATFTERPAAATAAADDQVLALFDECAPGIRRYVASFNLSGTATDDVVQDVFLALFRHLSLGRPTTHLKGWLFQVAHNLALKQRQRTAKRAVIEATWEAAFAEQVRDDGLNPEQRLAEEQRQRHLQALLRRMPERDRRCIHLRAEGLRYRDIAKTLGVSLGTVAKSVVRALTRLTAADTE